MAKSGDPGMPANPVNLADDRQAADRRMGWMFAGLFLLYMFDYIDREIVSSLIPFLKADLGITDTQAGSLASAVYWAIIVLAFPASILVDRWSRKRSVGIMVMLWSLFTGAAAFVKTFPQLFTVRLGVGVGESGYSPGGTAMISAMYPVQKRSRMMGLWNVSIPLGSAIGVGLGGVIAKAWSWKHAFGLVAIPGFIIGLLFFFMGRDYRTVKLEKSATATQAARKMKVGDLVGEFGRKPSLILTYIGFAGNTFLTSAFLTWLPSYFNRIRGVAADKAGLLASVVMISSAVGVFVTGYLVDAWRKRLDIARPLYAGLTSLLSAAIWFVALAWLTGTAQLVAMFVAAISTLLYLPAAAAVTQDVVHPGLWAVSYSICVVVQNLLGSSTGPLVVGAISDKWGLNTAMMSVPAASVFAGVLFLLATVFYRRDLAKVDKVAVEMEE